jgi:hypothetical protein
LRTRRTGKLYPRRSRADRAGITGLTALAILSVWYLVPELALRIGFTALILLGLPAFVILALDRRI